MAVEVPVVSESDLIELLSRTADKKPRFLKFWKTWNGSDGKLVSEETFYFGISVYALDTEEVAHAYVALAAENFAKVPGGHCGQLPSDAGMQWAIADLHQSLCRMLEHMEPDLENPESAILGMSQSSEINLDE